MSSSDNRAPERMLIDARPRKVLAALLPHEMFIRERQIPPSRGLATPDYSSR